MTPEVYTLPARSKINPEAFTLTELQFKSYAENRSRIGFYITVYYSENNNAALVSTRGTTWLSIAKGETKFIQTTDEIKITNPGLGSIEFLLGELIRESP